MLLDNYRRVRVSGECEDSTSIEAALEDFFTQIETNPLLKGNLLEDISLSASTTTVVRHKLNIIPKGYIIVSQSQPASIYLQDKDSTTLTLYSSADVTVSLYVF